MDSTGSGLDLGPVNAECSSDRYSSWPAAQTTSSNRGRPAEAYMWSNFDDTFQGHVGHGLDPPQRMVPGHPFLQIHDGQ